MNEEKNAPAGVAGDDGNSAVVEEKDAAQDPAEDLVFTDTDTEETDDDGASSGADGAATEKAPKAEAKTEGGRSSENARRRREAEQKQKVDAAKVAGVIEALDGVNPYTGEAMKDARDVEQYLLQKQIKKRGGDPVADYASEKTKADREAAAKAEAQEKEKEHTRQDLADFRGRYPAVDVSALLDDPAFCDYAEGKMGVKPMYAIYEGYQKLVGSQKAAARKAQAAAIANNKAAVGSTAGTADTELTAKDIRKMSYEQRCRLYAKNPAAYKAAMKK